MNNKFKISALTWIEEFGLPDGSYSILDIQDYFEYILKKQGEKHVIKIYINKIENRIMFKIKKGYYLELLIPETMKLLGSTESKIKDKNGENAPYSDITEVVLIHYAVNNSYLKTSTILHTSVPKKSFGQLLDISPQNFIFLKNI